MWLESNAALFDVGDCAFGLLPPSLFRLFATINKRKRVNRKRYRMAFACKQRAWRQMTPTRPDEGLPLETSAFESLYGGQFTLSTPLVKPNYLIQRTCGRRCSQVLEGILIWLDFRHSLKSVLRRRAEKSPDNKPWWGLLQVGALVEQLEMDTWIFSERKWTGTGGSRGEKGSISFPEPAHFLERDWELAENNLVTRPSHLHTIVLSCKS